MDKARIDELIAAAFEVRENAYAPYSEFTVGAALLGMDGRIYTGCNVENGSYSLTSCAERNAVFTAVAEGCRNFAAVALAGGRDFIVHCGACRQVLSEFNVDRIILTKCDGSYKIVALKDLLPCPFSL